MQRRTKIVGTLGPAINTPELLEAVFRAGVNVVRLNFSHGSSEQHIRRATEVREVAKRLGINIGIMVDLQGPKIRIARFTGGSVSLHDGDPFVFDTQWDPLQGNRERVGVEYPQLPADCQPGDVILLDDGRIRMRADAVDDSTVRCTVLTGGELSNNKGINKEGGGLSAHALTPKDLQDIETAAAIHADFVAVSFPRCAADMEEARQHLHRAGSRAALVAKIERAEVVASDHVLDELIHASDVVMVARGDLGVEIGDAELIGVQKKIISRAQRLNRVVITATQMMESMIHSPVPTRAEVFDVANAVLDGTDAVMLSAETASGDFPVEVVAAMARVCIGAEKQPVFRQAQRRLDHAFRHTDESIAMAAMFAAHHLPTVKAIICLTESGATPLWMSRIPLNLPIYALTRHETTLRRVSLYRCVEGIPFDSTGMADEAVNAAAIAVLKQRGLLASGDQVILTKGVQMGVHGATNTMQVLFA